MPFSVTSREKLSSCLWTLIYNPCSKSGSCILVQATGQSWRNSSNLACELRELATLRKEKEIFREKFCDKVDRTAKTCPCYRISIRMKLVNLQKLHKIAMQNPKYEGKHQRQKFSQWILLILSILTIPQCELCVQPHLLTVWFLLDLLFPFPYIPFDTFVIIFLVFLY